MEKNYTVDWFSGNIQNWDSIFDHYKFKNIPYSIFDEKKIAKNIK